MVLLFVLCKNKGFRLCVAFVLYTTMLIQFQIQPTNFFLLGWIYGVTASPLFMQLALHNSVIEARVYTLKGQCPGISYPSIFCFKHIGWAPNEQAKTVSRSFQFRQETVLLAKVRILQKKLRIKNNCKIFFCLFMRGPAPVEFVTGQNQKNYAWRRVKDFKKWLFTGWFCKNNLNIRHLIGRGSYLGGPQPSLPTSHTPRL